MSLKQIQEYFIRYLYTFEPEKQQKEMIRSYFIKSQIPDPHNGLDVYRHHLVLGLIGTMKETYVLTRVLLGENNFNFFCRDFLYQNPSRDTDLIQYGMGFGEFLETRLEVSHIPFIADVARLEWSLERVFYAKARKSMGKDSFNQGNKPLVLKKTIQLISTRYKIHEAWLSFMDKGEEGIRLEMFQPEPEYLVVWPDEGTPKVTPVSRVLFLFLERAMENNGVLPVNPSHELSEEKRAEAYEFVIRQGWVVQ